jgi:glycosyltransferase involved in cell wall biosynthesis
MSTEPGDQARRAAMIEEAFRRGQQALASGDQMEASHWLDRAHRLAPADVTLAIALASALMTLDPARSARLFRRVLTVADIGAAWFGLAAAQLRAGSPREARRALHQGLSRHAPYAGLTGIADQIAEAVGAAGWSGVNGDGTIIARSADGEPVQIRLDGRRMTAMTLPDGWRRAARVTVTSGGRHLIGSPVSVRAIGRVEGFFEADGVVVRGWAWHPGAPDQDPVLTVTMGEHKATIVATTPADTQPGSSPLARVRAFAFPIPAAWRASVPVQVRGSDGEPLTAAAETKSLPIEPPRRWPTVWNRTVIILTHDDGGGVARRVDAAVASLKRRGRSVIILKPARSDIGGNAVRIETGDGIPAPGSVFRMPEDRDAFSALLRATKPVELVLHHTLNHAPSVLETLLALGIPYDAHIHDFIWFCPRIALVSPDGRYCGEPALSGCEDCAAKPGGYLSEDLPVRDLIARSRVILEGARRVIAPSHDAGGRIERHFPGLRATVIPHDDDRRIPERPPTARHTGVVRICVAGAIGLHKGHDVLLALARDARDRALALEFRVAGTTIDDQSLMETGRVFVTGPYEPAEAVPLIQAQNAALALLPSIWPETWCLALSELWRAGLRVAAFDIGAPAERIRATGRGFLLRLGMSPAAINDSLMNAVSVRSVLPIPAPTSYKGRDTTTLSK